MELQEQFNKETGIEKPLSNGFCKITYQQEYIKWLESKVKKLNIGIVSKCECGETKGLITICDDCCTQLCQAGM